MARRNLAIILILSVLCNLLLLNQLVRRDVTGNSLETSRNRFVSELAGRAKQISEQDNVKKRDASSPQQSLSQSQQQQTSSRPNENNNNNNNYKNKDAPYRKLLLNDEKETKITQQQTAQKLPPNSQESNNSNKSSSNRADNDEDKLRLAKVLLDETLSKLAEIYLEQKLIFVVGAMSSGTTLMRLILDVHPDVNCGDETKIVHLMLEFVQSIYRDRFYVNFMKSSGVKNETINKVRTTLRSKKKKYN